jgi:hypothetical protein
LISLCYQGSQTFELDIFDQFPPSFSHEAFNETKLLHSLLETTFLEPRIKNQNIFTSFEERFEDLIPLFEPEEPSWFATVPPGYIFTEDDLDQIAIYRNGPDFVREPISSHGETNISLPSSQFNWQFNRK